MPRRKRMSSPTDTDMPVEVFHTTEEAWFWYARTQVMRNDGARPERRTGTTRRPCDPDDIYRAVMQLRRSSSLEPAHLVVLARYGIRSTPPDVRIQEEQLDARRWDEAIDRLRTVLVAKGIVQAEVYSYYSSHYAGTG